jgi:two-component system sensor histidine kinase YesM
MHVYQCFHSLRFRMYLFLALLLTGVSLLLLYNNVAAANILRAEVCSAAQRMLKSSQEKLDGVFSGTSLSLATISYQNTEIKAIERNRTDTTNYYVALERIKRQFSNSTYASSMDSFFFYNPQETLYFGDVNDLNNPVRAALAEGTIAFTKQTLRNWTILRCSKGTYLLRAIRVSDSYIGSWVHLEKVLRQVQNDQLPGSRVYLLDQAGALLPSGDESLTLETNAANRDDGYTFITLSGSRWLAVTQKLNAGDFSLAALIPDASISSRLNHLTVVIIAAALLAFAIFTFGAALLRWWIVRPVQDLTSAIRALQSGDFQASLPQQTYVEFQEVNQAFNEATTEIQRLKIDMYEEKLLKQRIQMQYLQLQVAPHFLINCLNTVYQLTDANQPELTRAMLRTLSKHLRYTLSPHETVRLRDELSHVENYVELSSIRYHGSIRLIKECSADAEDALVIPLMVLSFVENTIKHEAVVGAQLEIHVSASVVPALPRSEVRLCIWDTGGGFSPEVLEDLQDIHAYLLKYGDIHIGIGNVFQRTQILFETCRFTFTNRPGAGAQIDIAIPCIPFGKGGSNLEPVDRG